MSSREASWLAALGASETAIEGTRERARESEERTEGRKQRERERERRGGTERDSRYSFASYSALAFCVAFARSYLGLGHGADRVR